MGMDLLFYQPPFFWFQVFHQMLNLAVGICSHSATRPVVRSKTDVGCLGLALRYQRCFLIDLALCIETLSC